MAVSFEIGAAFIVEDRATEGLAEIGRAFERLDELATKVQDRLNNLGETAFSGIKASVDRAYAEVDRLIAQAAELGRAWGAAGGSLGGGGRGRGGGGLSDDERQLREDRRNAEAENRNLDQIYRREEHLAQLLNNDLNAQERRRGRNQSDRDRGDLYGPPEADGYGGYDEAGRMNDSYNRGQRMSAEEENRRRDAAARAKKERRAEYASGLGGVMRGMAPFGAAIGGIEAESTAWHTDSSLFQTLLEMGYDANDPKMPQYMAEMRAKVVESTNNSIYSWRQGSGVLPGTAGQFGAVFDNPDERRTKYEEVLPHVLRFAEVAEQFDRGNLRDSTKAGIDYAHMTGRYGGKELESGLDHLLALSLTTGATVADEQNVLKYSVPLGRAAGVDPDDIAALTGFFQLMGFKGTTAGTGIGQLLMGLTTTGGPTAAHLHESTQKDLSHQFENVLHLGDAKELRKVRESRGKPHDTALHDLGFTDASGKLVSGLETPDGKLVWQKFVSILAGGLQQHTPMQDLELLRNAFTVRGSREAALLDNPDVVNKLEEYLKNMAHPQSAVKLQEELQTRPLQQWEQLLANLSNLGNTLATGTLPLMNTMLVNLNTFLIGMNTFLAKHGTIAEVGGVGLIGGAAAYALGLFGKGQALWRGTLAPAARAVGSLIPGVGASALSDAAIGVGGGDAIGTAIGLASPLGAMAIGVAGGSYLNAKMGNDMVDDYGRVIGRWGGGAPRPSPALAPNVTVNVGGINNSGIGESDPVFKKIKDDVMSAIMSAIHGALGFSTADPKGTPSSVYTQPGFGL